MRKPDNSFFKSAGSIKKVFVIFIPTIDFPFVYKSVPGYSFKPGYANTYAMMIAFPLPDEYKYLGKNWPPPEGAV